jgi:hypothetical protein
VTEEYMLYDNGSFIADFGGYLGLLLGASLLSLIEEILETVTDKCCGNRKNKNSPKIELEKFGGEESPIEQQ